MAFLSVRSQPATEPVAFSFPEKATLLARHLAAMPKLAQVTPASRLEVRPVPEMVSTGIPQIDALTDGLPRGSLSEIVGAASSGRTSVLLAALAAATQRQEVCALVDATDAFDPRSAAAVGISFDGLLWVRCSACHAERSRNFAKRSSRQVEASLLPPKAVPDKRIPRFTRNGTPDEQKLEQTLHVTDLLLQSGGFGLLAIDLSDVPVKFARRIPLTSWFRFQRAVENTPTVLLVIGQTSCAQTCAALVLQLRNAEELSAFRHKTSDKKSSTPAHAQLFRGLSLHAEVLRRRWQRKPPLAAASFSGEVVFSGKAG